MKKLRHIVGCLRSYPCCEYGCDYAVVPRFPPQPALHTITKNRGCGPTFTIATTATELTWRDCDAIVSTKTLGNATDNKKQICTSCAANTTRKTTFSKVSKQPTGACISPAIARPFQRKKSRFSTILRTFPFQNFVAAFCSTDFSLCAVAARSRLRPPSCAAPVGHPEQSEGSAFAPCGTDLHAAQDSRARTAAFFPSTTPHPSCYPIKILRRPPIRRRSLPCDVPPRRVRNAAGAWSNR
jgi:hypothetical protein